MMCDLANEILLALLVCCVVFIAVSWSDAA
jgi:hypothetical protein